MRTRKNLIDLTLDECYTQILVYFLLKQVSPFRFMGIYYHYYQHYINPAAIKIHKHFWQILLFHICLNESYSNGKWGYLQSWAKYLAQNREIQ